MAGPLGKLTAVLGLDAREFSAGIANANKSLGGFGTGARVAFGLAAGAATLGFGAMLKGSQEMERAQGDFQAATGRSREEAVAFSKDMNGIVGTASTVGASFADIAKAGTAVAQQFGLTGKAGTDLTEDFLGFAKVTGQDATGAVNDFDAALDAFGEPAERATGLMDQLVASNQKYGTDAGPAALSALQGMAPALQAMGAGLDDGIGLLNLFETAGLDASAAQMGLKKAIAELKPGQSLDDLIAQIGAIEDPTLRAQEAMRIFGTRSGAGLANAIKPGMSSLDDFKVSMEDVEGTAQTAAENMLTTGDKIRMFAEKAGAALRGLGQEFGPLVSGLGMIGSLLGPALGKAWTSLAGSAPMKAAAGAAGAAASAAYALGMKVVDAISGAASAAWNAIITSAPVKAAAGAAGAAASAAYVVGMAAVSAIAAPIVTAFNAMTHAGSAVVVESLAAGGVAGRAFGLAWAAGAVLAVPAIAAAIGNAAFEGLKGFMVRPDADLGGLIDERMAQVGQQGGTVLGETAVDAANVAVTEGLMHGPPAPPEWLASLPAAGAAAGALTGAAWASATLESFRNGNWGAAAEAVVPALRAAGQAGQLGFMDAFRNGDWSAAADAAHAVVASLNRGLQESLPSAHAAWKSFVAGMGKELDPLAELAWLQGRLGGHKLAEGLASKNIFARQNAEDMRDTIVGQIADLQRLLGIEGEQGGAAVVTAIDKKKGPAGTAAQAVRDAAVKKLDFKDAGRTAGEEGVGAYTSGISGGKGIARAIIGPGAAAGGSHGGGASGAAGSVRGAVVGVLSNTTGFSGYGSATTGEYARGIASGYSAATNAALKIANAVRAILRATSPPEHALLRDIGKWGRSTIEEYASGLRAGVGVVEQAMGKVAAAVAAPAMLTPMFALSSPGIGQLPRSISGSQTLRHEHTVKLDLANAPPGITNDGVARIVYDVIARESVGKDMRWDD